MTTEKLVADTRLCREVSGTALEKLVAPLIEP